MSNTMNIILSCKLIASLWNSFGCNIAKFHVTWWNFRFIIYLPDTGISSESDLIIFKFGYVLPEVTSLISVNMFYRFSWVLIRCNVLKQPSNTNKNTAGVKPKWRNSKFFNELVSVLQVWIHCTPSRWEAKMIRSDQWSVLFRVVFQIRCLSMPWNNEQFWISHSSPEEFFHGMAEYATQKLFVSKKTETKFWVCSVISLHSHTVLNIFVRMPDDTTTGTCKIFWSLNCLKSKLKVFEIPPSVRLEMIWISWNVSEFKKLFRN